MGQYLDRCWSQSISIICLSTVVMYPDDTIDMDKDLQYLASI